MPDYRLKIYRGKWAAVWTENGRSKRSSLGTADKAIARTRFSEFVRLVGTPEPAAVLTIGAIFEAYMADRTGETNTVYIIRCYWKALEPHFGHLTVPGLTREACRAYAARRAASGIQDGTTYTELGYLKTALNFAVREQLITMAPAVWRPAKPTPRERYLTRDEASKLIAAAALPHLRLFVILAITTGGRTGAILDLTWDRVDFNRRLIYLANPERGVTKKGRATVPINTTAYEALREAQDGAVSDTVVEWAGRNVASVKKGFATAARIAGLSDVTPHTLRHTAAVWMAEDGHSMASIANYLGHRDSKITERVYARFSPEYLKGPAAALEIEIGGTERKASDG